MRRNPRMEYADKCQICGKPVDDFVPQYCCDGRECGCGGGIVNPCVCSAECESAIYDHIGKPFDERRELAGIAVWEEVKP